MITASLILNILVLIPVCLFLFTNNSRMERTLGHFTPARGILLAIYLTILFSSVVLLFVPDMKLLFALFFLQIIYKMTSAFTVRTIRNPVVISNVFIALFHSFTVYTMFTESTIRFAG